MCLEKLIVNKNLFALLMKFFIIYSIDFVESKFIILYFDLLNLNDFVSILLFDPGSYALFVLLLHICYVLFEVITRDESLRTPEQRKRDEEERRKKKEAEQQQKEKPEQQKRVLVMILWICFRNKLVSRNKIRIMYLYCLA